MKTAVIGAIALATLSACGSKDDDSSGGGGLETMGMLGNPSPALIGQNVVLVDVTLNGHSGGRLIVDTGAPLTLVQTGWFSGAMLPTQAQLNVDIGLGALTIDQVPVLQNLTATAMDQLRLAGLLGGNVLRQFSTTFNYRDREFQIGAGAALNDVAPAASIPFKLSGGGVGMLNGAVFHYPATRIPLTVSIEGVDHRFVLDTGASDIAVRVSVFDALVADGRPTMNDMQLATVYGPKQAHITRARSVSVAGQVVTNLPVLAFDDSIIDGISSELGYTIDGLLGGDFLREFALTVDYPAERVELSRYSTRDHIVDEFKRAGLWLTLSGPSSFAVGTLRHGGGAEKLGIAVGDEVLSINGRTLTELDLLSADSLLDGEVGVNQLISFGHTQNPALTETTLSVPVEDLVPALN